MSLKDEYLKDESKGAYEESGPSLTPSPTMTSPDVPKVSFPSPHINTTFNNRASAQENASTAGTSKGMYDNTNQMHRSPVPPSQAITPSRSTKSEQGSFPEERELRKELDEALQASNNLLGFIGTIAVFIASVGVSMLSFVHDKFADRGDSGRTSDHVIYACLYVSICLALIPAALCIITHSGLLQALSAKATLAASKGPNIQTEAQTTVVSDDVKCNLLRGAIKQARSYDDSLFWVGWFLFPSVVALIVGLTLLVWADHAKGVATAMTVVLAYCSAHVAILLWKLVVALFKGHKIQE